MFTTFHSLVYSTANGTTLDTLIQCNSSVAIVMTNVTDLTMKNMIIKGCNEGMRIYRPTFTIENCVNIVLNYMQIYSRHYHGLYLLVMNALGKSRFSHISCNKIHFIYHEIQARNVSNTILIDHLQQVGYVNSTYINIFLHQHSYEIAIQLTNITFQQQHSEFLYGNLQSSMLSIMDCEFWSSRSPIINVFGANDNSIVVLINCKFIKNTNWHPLINTCEVNVIVINCTFNGSLCLSILTLIGNTIVHNDSTTVVIKDTQFFDSIDTIPLTVTYVNLLLEGLMTFHNITRCDSIIELKYYNTITIHGRVKFSSNSAYYLIIFLYNNIQYIKIK